VLVPRHHERGGAVGDDLRAAGIRHVFRSEITAGYVTPPEPPECLVVNTTGELRHFYERADVVFVGKSLTAQGGQNPIEPAALGKPAVFGPHMQNFPEIAPAFVRAGGALQVADASELQEALDRLLGDPALREEMGRRALAVVRENQGSIGRTVAMILETLRPGALADQRRTA
jgi:3-deoxy-D-manno-octulosonic-acid transferase